MARPRLTHILESSLYVAELERSRDFYQRLFGFEVALLDERMCALVVPGAQVLLLFRRGGSTHPSPGPNGLIPPHDAAGQQHLCFAVPAAELSGWEALLAAEGIEIESRLAWPKGGASVYFRDPDGHSLELATPGLWPGY
jgi:catechol 2,3-dioxygenase-like lactoylglutathione lyase family enzyme